MAATQTEPVFSYEPPVVAFEVDGFVETPGLSFDITAERERLLVVKRATEMPLTTVRLLQDWPPRLGDRVAGR